MTVVLFDVDGVFLSEERCFDVSALAVHEMLYSPRYLNLEKEKFKIDYTDEEIDGIRASIFSNDEVLERFKKMGLNSNWDMLFVTFSVLYINLIKYSSINVDNVDISDIYTVGEMLGDVEVDYSHVVDFLKEGNYTKDTIYTELIEYARRRIGLSDPEVFDMHGPVWTTGQYKYQEWYLGSADVKTSTGMEAEEEGKKGFINDEEWIRPPEDIKAMLKRLIEAGVEIGVATGRPRQETLIPFHQHGLMDIFRSNRVSTASEVLAAEGVEGVDVSLAKPHPYSYLWSLYGHDETHFEDAVDKRNVSKEKIFIIGDSIADFYCAEAIGADFIATLTGLTGEEIIPDFETLGVTNMVESVLETEEIILKNHHK
ncbi:hypothetical protein WN59_11985 [Salinicoccus sediminis]|uniref:Haloacid dehalogenase n=1 Tax=Salinicoccus sediminis TaxID=1432562 RepID=A0A0M2SKS8_9STAP|nr:HAD hydrolase-like protein [Salinicoccus sediminis]KKK33462.1 hypothetical protein WN59_11985 [Salinicoccus sediminis]